VLNMHDLLFFLEALGFSSSLDLAREVGQVKIVHDCMRAVAGVAWAQEAGR